jgi:hypothetical protein
MSTTVINPHCWVHIDVKKPDGEVERWTIEGGAPNALLRRGWTKKSLPEGTEIIVEGFQAKDGALRANGRDIHLSGRQEAVRRFVRDRDARRAPGTVIRRRRQHALPAW